MHTTVTDWNGHRQVNFTIEGREAFLVCPHTAAPGNPWVWRTRFFGAFDAVDRALLSRGWHLVSYNIDGAEQELLGAPLAIQRMAAFHDLVEREFALSPRAVLFGFSRGGTYAVRYAHEYPARVGALYLDAPLTDYGAFNVGGYPELWEFMKTYYGLNEETITTSGIMPNDYAADVARAGIPVVGVTGTADEAVDYRRNIETFKEKFEAVGGRMLYFTKPGVGHLHSFEDAEHVNAIADFLETYWVKE